MAASSYHSLLPSKKSRRVRYVPNAAGFCVLGIADKMKSVRLVQIFCPIKETNRTHSKGYVEDLSTQRGRKRYAKMAVLNLSVLPYLPCTSRT